MSLWWDLEVLQKSPQEGGQGVPLTVGGQDTALKAWGWGLCPPSEKASPEPQQLLS